MIKSRASQVALLLAETGLDAFCFSSSAQVRYLCGFSGSEGTLLVAGTEDCFLTDSRYTTQAQNQVNAGRIVEFRNKQEAIIAFLQERGCRRVGFEAEHLSFADVRKLREKSPEELEWVPVEKGVTRLRGQKDASEIAALEQATTLAAEAFAEILPLVRPGTSEREIALALEFAMKRRGGEELAFATIVASGQRGALPHGVASDKLLHRGELVTIDFGVRLGGYHSDETVTVALGEVSPALSQIYTTVLQAHDLAISAIRPGVPLVEIDAVARRHIEQQGFGERFGHGLGHGVGLEVHEFPNVSPKSEASAQAGMVFTVEPGVYVPGLGGVRIEDMILVTESGCRVLTRIDKQLRMLPV